MLSVNEEEQDFHNITKKLPAGRVIKPVSFNRVKDKKLIDLTANFNFSSWAKNILSNYMPSEVSLLKSGKDILPAVLIEKSIEEGAFSIDEYLRSKGKKIVDIDSSDDVFASEMSIDSFFT